jgi:hypothetical protein
VDPPMADRGGPGDVMSIPQGNKKPGCLSTFEYSVYEGHCPTTGFVASVASKIANGALDQSCIVP